MAGAWRDDRGGATVWVLSAGVLIVLLAGVEAAAGAAITARHRAYNAADLAALAGAARAVEGERAACSRAGQVAAANGAVVVACRLDGWDLMVTVQVRPGGLAGLAGVAQAQARAGPS
jgi:secretion/DNA translocation related TadE-like protein